MANGNRSRMQPPASHDLTGKVALITGAGTGFGRSMSKAFCAAGAQVIGVGRRADRLEETARLAGPRFTPMPWDVSKTREARDFVKQVTDKLGVMHILVNDAAVMLDNDVPLSKLSLDAFETTWQINVSGMFALSQAAFEPMRKQSYGRIVNVSSGLGFFPMLEYGSYCVSKAAVNMLTRVFAIDGARDGILVNAIDPGVAKTEMNPTAADSPDSINKVALYLASLPNSGQTGKCFNKRLQLVEW